MAIIDKIQLSGTVYTIGNETTTAVTSASTDNEIPTAKAVYDAIPQGGGGGGKTISAGTNISITTGETADTINCTLPIETISNPYGVSQIYVGDNIYKNSNYEAIVIANKDDSSTGETRVEFAHGAISIGSSNKVFQNGIAIGHRAIAGASNSWNDIAIGVNVTASGSTKTNINNQIKVDDKNQIYIYNKDNTEMICLQDQLGSGSVTVDTSLDSGSTNPVANSAITNAINEKQNKLTASGGISINQYQNTIFLDVPIYKAKDFRSCFVGYDPNWPNIVSGRYSFAVGLNNNVTGNYSLAVGGLDSYGEGNSATTINTFAFGRGNIAKSFCSTVVGYHNSSSNGYETAFGKYNNSVSASTTFGDSGNTLFSVGNGTNNARHNAFEIRQNGDIYISKDGQDVKLQDQLGGGGSSYTAGDGIDINNNVISVTGKVDTSAITTSVTSESTDAQVPSAKAVYDQFGGIKLVKLTQSEYSEMEQAGTLDNSTLYVIVN